MEREEDILKKSVLLRFICDDDPIGNSFLSHIESDYYAAEITYLFQNLALAAFTIITSAVGTYLVYKTRQQPEEMIDKERLINEIQMILKNHHDEIEKRIKSIEEKIGHFDNRYQMIIDNMMKERKTSDKTEDTTRHEIEDELIKRDEADLEKYREKMSKLNKYEDAAKLLVEIIEEEYEKGHEAQRNHVNRFRQYYR